MPGGVVVIAIKITDSVRRVSVFVDTPHQRPATRRMGAPGIIRAQDRRFGCKVGRYGGDRKPKSVQFGLGCKVKSRTGKKWDQTVVGGVREEEVIQIEP